MNTIVTLGVLVYDFLLVAGTAYLVVVHDWSMWTFLLTLLFGMSITKKDEKNEG